MLIFRDLEKFEAAGDPTSLWRIGIGSASTQEERKRDSAYRSGARNLQTTSLPGLAKVYG